MNNPLDLFAWKVRSERKRQHLTQRKLAERLNMNARTIIDLETCQSNPKFETVALVAQELNISVDAAIFPDMVNQTVSKTVVDFFAGKSEAEIEKYIRFLYKGIIIKHNKTEPTYTKTSLFLCEKRRFFMARTEKGVVTTI